MNSILYYDLNDYNILQDIEALNKKIEQKNKKMKQLHDKVEKVKQDLAAGNMASIGAGSQNLANTLLKTEELKKVQRQMERANPGGVSPMGASAKFSRDGSIMMSPKKPAITPKPSAAHQAIAQEQDDDIYEGGEGEEAKVEEPNTASAEPGAAEAGDF